MGRLSPETDPLELVFARLDEGSSSAGAGNVLPVAASPSASGVSSSEVAPDLPASAKIDLSLESAVSALVDRLVKPLQSFYPQSRIDSVRSHLIAALSRQYAPTWREDDPLHGTGYRSLICLPGVGLPPAMVAAARQNAVDPAVWMRSLAARLRGENSPLQEEWQAWCDPGLVMWRYGGWFWNDSEFDPVKSYREPLQTIWAAPNLLPAEGGGPSASTAPSVSTPLRASRAIPIRAPQLFAVPPTPSSEIGTQGKVPASLLPSASIAHPSPLRPGLSRELSSTGSPVQKRNLTGHSRTPSASHDGQAARASSGHRGSDSQSSVDSIAAGIQLLTPGTRPGSANPFQDPASGSDAGSAKAQETPVVPMRGRDPSPNTPRYPSESASGTPTNAPQTTPYDNGNVIVIGGGVKLGGSRPASAAPHSRRAGDRDRSPSISIASRALSSVMSNGSRKTRSRRRIMPSYLGHLDQPGVGGPVHGPFAAAPPVAPGAQPAPMPWNLLPGQPAQMLPVAQMLMADPKMQAGVQSAIRAATQLLRQPGQPLQQLGQKGGTLVVNTPAGPVWIPADQFLSSAWSGSAAPASGSVPAPAPAATQAQAPTPTPAQRM